MSEPEQIGGGVRSAEDVVLDIVRHPVLFRDFALDSYTGAFTYERLQLGDCVLQLLLETSEFRSRAASYRSFDVAAGALCKGEGTRFGRVLGHNVKLDDTDYVNIHAEDLVTTKARDAELGDIAVLAVVGPVQEDHASGALMDTLHPCGRCRDRLLESPLVSDATLFVMARPDFTVIQLGSLTDIRGAHNGGGNNLATFRYLNTPPILRPRTIPDEWNSRMEPVVVEEIDSQDYDLTVGHFLLQRYAQMQREE